MKGTTRIGIVLAAMVFSLISTGAFGQDNAKNSIEIYYLRWLQNDITRNVEEIRRAKDPWERRDLVEDIEQYIYDRVEFPLSYRKSDLVEVSNYNRIGLDTGVEDSMGSNPEAQEIAVAYALLGIAKGYEGFGVAATDYFQKAKEMFPRVMDVEVELDHNQDKKRLSEWISNSRGFWGNSSTTRVTFWGKRVSQEVVDAMSTTDINFATSNRKVSKYTLFVARRDFIRGLTRYIATDDSLKEYRPNKFSIYLEPGEYRIKTSVSSLYDIRMRVSRNVSENNFILETLHSGITCYPIPDIQVFEEEMQKRLMKARERQGDMDLATDLLGDQGGGLDFPLE